MFRDWNTIWRAAIAMVSGILALVLSAVAGVTDTNNAGLLRVLAVWFGFVITLLQIIMACFLEVFLAVATVGEKEEAEWRALIKSTEPKEIVVGASKVMLDAINQLKRARDLLEEGAAKTALSNQIADLEKSFGPLGTDEDPKETKKQPDAANNV